ncbi:MAG TPA: hypothetical protein VMU39_06230 [Solirubrobacteraceae bacterium]|nr:hypothetical protein [Solirubrobacteraceae bacterium]
MNSHLTYLMATQRTDELARSAAQARLAQPSHAPAARAARRALAARMLGRVLPRLAGPRRPGVTRARP